MALTEVAAVVDEGTLLRKVKIWRSRSGPHPLRSDRSLGDWNFSIHGRQCERIFEEEQLVCFHTLERVKEEEK